MKIIPLLLAVSLSCTGCGVAYRQNAETFLRTQPEAAWGALPDAVHVQVERDYIETRLKDPMSAQLTADPLFRGTIAASVVDPTVTPVWISRWRVNAKNSFGGYTGFKEWVFYYRETALIAVENQEEGRRYR